MRPARCLLFFSPLLFCFSVLAQPARPLPPGEILLGLKRLNVLGTALYVAAHPDDENTAMLAWLAKEKLVRTGYLSLTRGDGGQNLIGPEQAELMGLIRTYELLEARKIDGAEQFFTRANDFGFSKNTAETMEIWGKADVMADVVRRIRQFRPDVIICRFPPDPRAGHGNHSASAVFAEEAFRLAADPTQFPEQLRQGLQPWQARRVVWNTFAFGAATAQRPTEGSFIPVEIGGYNPLLAKSYTEIAAESRSQHKSQGFGVPKLRGLRGEYLVHKAGEPASRDVFDGVDLTWNRVKGGNAVQATVNEAIRQFNPTNPGAILPLLVKAYRQLDGLSDEYWKTRKRQELTDLITACAGLWYEANPTEYAVAGGERIRVNVSVVERSEVRTSLDGIRLVGLGRDTTLRVSLGDNELFRTELTGTVPQNQPITQPYWLAQPKVRKGLYRVDDPALIGLPEKPADLAAEFSLTVEGLPLTLRVPLTHKYVDDVRGELYRPFEVRPEVTATLADKVVVFPDATPKRLELTLKATKANASGGVSLDLPAGWRAEPQQIPFSLTAKYQEEKVAFTVYPTCPAGVLTTKAIVKTVSGLSDRGLVSINYDHIPPLTVFPVAEAKLVRLDVQTRGRNLGYIAGAGDEVPAALRQIGYQVTTLDEKALAADLTAYDAIVVGVRAYNTDDRLRFANPRLLEYVKNGGTLVVQYQVNSNLQRVDEQIGPYPFRVGRERVTVEEAPIRFLKPDHPALNTPNKITASDFDGWVQERGLYFPTTWDDRYEALLSSNDPGEAPLNGGLLVAPYGKGWYVYTGYAFFRQLPAGVPGAYRLFANLISLGKTGATAVGGSSH
jgi:LmbE family N-acetylglucosaminyl deacetylase